MEEKNLVSVVIPTYNREACIKKAILSVLNQTYRNLEVIVVDDCSSDNTVEIVNTLNDYRVSCIVNENNRGACYSRNRGVEAAKGTIIAFEDSDDIWLPNKLEKNIEVMEKNNADVVFSSYVLNEKVVHPEIDLNQCDNKVKTLFLNTCIGTPTLVIKKDVFEREKFDERLPRFQDYDLAIRLALKYKIIFIPEVLVKAYASGDGITKNNEAAVVALKRIYKKHYKTIENDSDIGYELNIKLGKYTEESGGNGSKYFYKALKTKKTKKIIFEYILSRLRLYRIVYRLYDSKRSKY